MSFWFVLIPLKKLVCTFITETKDREPAEMMYCSAIILFRDVIYSLIAVVRDKLLSVVCKCNDNYVLDNLIHTMVLISLQC